jgi:phage shock protein PspC (stress-responsive transcriptional regulator)
MDTNKRLYRSRTDRKLAGVCGGLGEYFNVDPTLVRVLFVLATLAGGPGLLLYIVLWLVMPEASDEKTKRIEV